MPERPTLSIPQVAVSLGVCNEFAYCLARRGKLPGAFKLGRRWIVARVPFEKWLESH